MNKVIENRKRFYNTTIPNDWDVKSFGAVCEILLDGTHFSPKSKTGPFKYITSKNIRNEGLDLENISYVSEEEHRDIFKRCPVKFGDVLLTKDGAGTGACCMNTLKEEFSLLSSVSVLRADPTKMINEYLLQFIKSPLAQKIIKDAISGQAITRITLEKIRAFKITVPSLPEQTAISYILKLIDKYIKQNNQLVNKKELRKKWLMQNLLVGKKRVKGFETEKWQTIKIGDVFEFIKTYSISREGLTKENDGGSIYCIHYGDIHAFYESTFLDFTTQQNIPQIIDEEQIINDKDLLKEGDVIMADASEDYQGVGEVVEVVNINSKKVVGGLHTITLRGNPKVIANKFRGYLFMSERVRNILRKMATGTSVYSVTKTTLYNLSIPIPNSLKEQKAIAQILQAADKEIQLLKIKTENLRLQKKGLMQQLLTGKKRLKVK